MFKVLIILFIKTSIILQLITVPVIKAYSETLFIKKSYHIEIGQLICKAINLLVSIWYEFLLKGISQYTIAQVFFKDMLIFKKQNNIDSLKITYRLALPFIRLNSSKWKALYWVECYINCYVYFNCLLLLTKFLGYTVGNVSKYGLEKIPYLDTFHAVKISCFQ